MTDQTTENFWQVWSSFAWPEPVVPSYRLYYNLDGSPKCYSMDQLADKYIEVDAETYACRPWNVRVVDEKLTYIQPPVTVHKLQPNSDIGTVCHPLNVCVIVSEDKPHIKWNKATNEIS
jgi:hypothetical protein